MKFNPFVFSVLVAVFLKLFPHPLMAAYYAPYIQEEMNYCHEAPSISQLNNVIQLGLIEAGEKNRDQLQDSKYPVELAFEILSVSKCFKIDPIILTGLIASESLFVTNLKNSIGATGLGQLMTPGIMEIANQLGAPGLKVQEYAPADQRSYFQSAIQCAVKENNFYQWRVFRIDTLPSLDIKINHWWNYQPVKNLNASQEMNPKLISFLKNNHLMNLIYSSMLIKIFYSLSRKNYGDQTFDQLSDLDSMAILQSTVSKYKGGGSNSTANAQYKTMRKWVNRTLQIMKKTSGPCYKMQYGI
ncbi:MAG: hypothetical protein QE271_13050 [Bacteriovoracaceae bacterium]|nr:hypothetical protein [Bacteriovoracaceae bacterium]